MVQTAEDNENVDDEDEDVDEGAKGSTSINSFQTGNQAATEFSRDLNPSNSFQIAQEESPFVSQSKP